MNPLFILSGAALLAVSLFSGNTKPDINITGDITDPNQEPKKKKIKKEK